MSTVDHKRIGVMYLVRRLVGLLHGRNVRPAGPAVAAEPEAHDLRQGDDDAETYNRMFTLHGAIMVFLFIIPSVPAALGNFVCR